MHWDGKLVLEGKYVLAATTRLADFMQWPLYSGQPTHLQFWLDGQYELWGSQFLITVYFQNGLLCCASLYCVNKQFNSGNHSWQDMNIAKEQQAQEKRKQFNDWFVKQYFQTQAGKAFPAVHSVVDKQNVSVASIQITYRKYWK